MKFADIIKGVLAPVVRKAGLMVVDNEGQTRVTIGSLNAAVYNTVGIPVRTGKGLAGYVGLYPMPFCVNTETRVRHAKVGDIGFAFWREPPRKLRRVA